jgi:murein L,D-transpeptidase YafK
MKRLFSIPICLCLGLSSGVTAQGVPSGTSTVIEAQDISVDSTIITDAHHAKSPQQIKKRIQALIGRTFHQWCKEADIISPPSCILLRTFKLEKECELWAGNDKDPLKLVKILRVCSLDDAPGPKLVMGDGKTPEGFYESYELYGSPYWWMWMKLTPQSLDKPGESDNGSSFRLCINYPNPADIARTRRLSGKSPGGEICIHGNCVTAGCISFRNRVFMMAYYFAAMHDTKRNGSLQVHIFPFRFSEELKKQYCGSYAGMKRTELLSFWNNIEEGYRLFEKTRRPLRFSCRQDRYVFVHKSR